ncbi:hypothetical protein X928_01505 [Petrotoga miotherma DSM 10691]|uniref:Uncharacterized protein n=1 Tax=Petrotoga miotherma DSM 10691 TaxID=1434326 RepID=A0A2K1PGW6_9BACT|nr:MULTISPECIES: hypothetical protein [Petrotoga]MDN5346354.1 hypothetical protein [Petrotoga sp.]PNS02033.1 hypothetical protein X928_01505 [Petrotoga miotherma DSM 10691]
MNTVNNVEPDGPVACGALCVAACAIACMVDGVGPILDFYGISAYATAEASWS